MTTKGSFAKRKIELPRSQPGGTRTSPCRQTRAERIRVLNPTPKENGAYCVRPLPLVAPVCPIRWRDVVVHLLISALAGATHTNQIANAATKHDAVIAVR